MVSTNPMSCSTTIRVLSSQVRNSSAVYPFPHRSRWPPAHQAAADAAPAPAACRSQETVSDHGQQTGLAAALAVKTQQAQHLIQPIVLFAAHPGAQATTDLSPFIAVARFPPPSALRRPSASETCARSAAGIATTGSRVVDPPTGHRAALRPGLAGYQSIRVVLPAPLGPITQRSSPTPIASDRSVSARKPSS